EPTPGKLDEVTWSDSAYEPLYKGKDFDLESGMERIKGAIYLNLMHDKQIGLMLKCDPIRILKSKIYDYSGAEWTQSIRRSLTEATEDTQDFNSVWKTTNI